jgi:hypothetical protein
MVAAQVHDADDRPEPRQYVGYRQLRTETVRWMKCARSNRKEEQMMTTGTKEKQSGAQVLTEAMAAAILRRYQEPLEQSCADRAVERFYR